MTKLKLSMLSLFALSLAACQTSVPSNCAGWQKIRLLSPTAIYLVKNDLPAGRSIAQHNAYGKAKACWK